jgi:phytanoyl-CoA hydroxylase
MLNQNDLAAFDRDGYLVVDRVLSQATIDTALAECWQIAAQLVRTAVDAGEVPTDLLDLPGPAQLIELTKRTGKSYSQHFDIALPLAATIRADTPLNLGAGVFAILFDPDLLDFVEGFLGPEIVCNPTEHVRVKLPIDALPKSAEGHFSRVGWHQDNSALLADADASHVLTAWTPLTDSTIENGTIVVFPGSHTRGLLPHCPGALGNAIPDALLGCEPVNLEMKAGSVLFFHRRTIHGSLENRSSSDVRVSLDLRYQPADEPTGRPLYPSFVVRSTLAPEKVPSHGQWADTWLETRARLAGRDLSGAIRPGLAATGCA